MVTERAIQPTRFKSNHSCPVSPVHQTGQRVIGLAQTISEGSWAGAKLYTAAEIYKSESVGRGGGLESGIARYCYASDLY